MVHHSTSKKVATPALRTKILLHLILQLLVVSRGFSMKFTIFLRSALLLFLETATSFRSSASTRNNPPLSTCCLQRYFVSRMSTSKESDTAPMGNLVISLREIFYSKQMRLILASQSPRRREILDMMGLADLYDTIPSPLDESSLQMELADRGVTKHPQMYTQTLAEEKARVLAESLRVELPTLVLGSDTIVDQDEAILEKPKDASDAHRMLRQLSGREHYVHTGVALYLCSPGKPAEKVVSFVEQATVQFTALSDADIEAYVASGEPMDKAGSYGIQGIGGQFVSSVQGDFFTVMGLPMHRTSHEIGKVIQGIQYNRSIDDRGDSVVVEKEDLAAPPSTGTTSKSGAWQERYQQLVEFQEAHGHCLVPKRYSPNKALANWVSKQRQAYRRYRCGEETAISHERIVALDRIGFCWNAQGHFEKTLRGKRRGSDAQWRSRWEELSDFMVKSGIKSVAEIPKYSDHASWIKKQRRKYLEDQNSQQRSLSEDQIELLNSLDPHWYLSRHEFVWEQRFNELVEYARQNGDCCVPISYSNKKLAHWVSNQRKFYSEQLNGKQNSLNDNRKQRLEKIGFVWNRWDYEFGSKNVM